MKAPTKTPAPGSDRGTDQPKALETLTAIVDLAVTYRFSERTPTLSDVARVVSSASRVLHVRDLDERIATENAAVLALAKKRGLVG